MGFEQPVFRLDYTAAFHIVVAAIAGYHNTTTIAVLHMDWPTGSQADCISHSRHTIGCSFSSRSYNLNTESDN